MRVKGMSSCQLSDMFDVQTLWYSLGRLTQSAQRVYFIGSTTLFHAPHWVLKSISSDKCMLYISLGCLPEYMIVWRWSGNKLYIFNTLYYCPPGRVFGFIRSGHIVRHFDIIIFCAPNWVIKSMSSDELSTWVRDQVNVHPTRWHPPVHPNVCSVQIHIHSIRYVTQWHQILFPGRYLSEICSTN